MVTEETIDENDVSRLRAIRRKRDTIRNDTDPGGRQKDFVARSFVHDFRIAGDDTNAGVSRRLCHRASDPAQEIDFHAFFNDRCARNVERLGASDREIIDRAANGELTDITARKEQGIDDEAVGRESNAIAKLRQSEKIDASLIF